MYHVFEKRTAQIQGVPYHFLCDPAPNQHPTWWCFEDENDVRQAWWTVKKDEIVIDAGAAFGSYALPALALGAAHVYAWAPERMDEVLLKNLEVNGWGADRATVFSDGLWNSSGFLLCPSSSSMPRVYATEAEAKEDPTPGVIFPVETLDKRVPPSSIKRLDWIKVDVEGAEVEVLEGAIELIRKFKPKLFVENHLFKDASIKNRVAALVHGLELGYQEIGTRSYHSVSHSLYVAK